MATAPGFTHNALDFHDKALEVGWSDNARGRIEVLTASATRIKVNDDDAIRKIIRRRYDSWQEDAWLFYDEIGEVKYALNFLANAMSKLRLFVGTRPAPDEPVVPVDPADRGEIPPTTPENPNTSAAPPGVSAELARAATAELARLRAAQGGQPEIMRRSALNMLVAGEFYLLGQNRVPGANPFDTDEDWTIRSIDELVATGNTFRLKNAPNDQGSPLDPSDYVARVHRAHGRWSEMADSNMRGVLASCEIVLMLDRMIRAIAKSRTHGGIFAVPDEVSFGSIDATTDEAGDGESTEDEFIEEFVKWLSDPATDEGSPASVAPGLLKVKGELIQYLKHFPLDRKLDDKIVELRTNELVRIAQGLDIQPEQMSGMGATNHWCQDDQTEVLTAAGWRNQADLAIGDEVLTLNHKTGLSEWQPVLDIYRASVVDEPMVRIEGRNHSSLSTPGHRWPVLRRRWTNKTPWIERCFTTTAELRQEDGIPTAAPCADIPSEPKYLDDLVEMVAWLWTEGNIGISKSVTIAQSHTRNPERVARIRACLTRLYGPPQPTLVGLKMPGWREVIQRNESSYGGPVTIFNLNISAASSLLEVAPNKRVSAAFIRALTPAQLELFVDVSGMGDGQHYRAGHSDMWQREPEMLDAYELALVLLGRMIVRGESDGGHRTGVWKQTVTRPVKAARAPTATERGCCIAEESYTGTVWCPTTANHTWFARRRGTTYFTGNSAWLIDDVTWRSNLEPLAVDLVNAWTTAFLLPGLIEQGFSVEEVVPLVVWYDPTPLLSRPNTSADAKDAFGNEAISGAAYRAVIGFDDSDAPDENELLLRMLMKPRGYSPELIDAIARKVFPDLEIIAPPAPGAPALTPQRPPASERPSEVNPKGAPPQDEGPGKPATPPETPLSAQLTQTFARRGVDVGARLADIDARLWARLEAALNVAMRQALQKAGARLRSKAGTLRASAKGVPNELVAAHLGVDAVHAAGFSEDELLAQSFDSLQTDFDNWTAASQRKALQLAADEGDLDEAEIEALAQRQEDDRNGAWEWLAAALIALAAERLYSPSPAAPPQGEHSDELAVPPGLIREAMARAGGADNLEPTPRGGILADGGTRPAGGIGTGDLIRGVLVGAGFQEQGWIWQWSGALRAFEPHQDLDAYEFDSLDDDALVPPPGYEWLDVDFMVPGDHIGCGCQLIPRLVAQVPAGVGSEDGE